MARIAGVKFEKDARGNKRYVRIDLKQHSEAVAPLLKKLGDLNGKTDDDDAAYKAEFEKKWATGITGDELFGHLHKLIDSHPWKK